MKNNQSWRIFSEKLWSYIFLNQVLTNDTDFEGCIIYSCRIFGFEFARLDFFKHEHFILKKAVSIVKVSA